eukprot:TRINITY_DN3663_c0_g1_i1.p1 TRINITY_DN3663_c0_g1~~TRINITY_DN3663_c0_g1_i1.p1  ORF type:complete len:155 (-),score=45.99 TRINITY_DN3663_c0_g1_i1:81-545(-)
MKIAALAIVLLAIVVSTECCSSSCCNYCNLTMVFESPCQKAFESLEMAVNTTKDFESGAYNLTSTPMYIDGVHTTVSKCCPPFYHYHEDVSFTSVSTTSDSCQLFGYSKSRQGACDLGNDEANLQKVADATNISYSYVVNSGCQGTDEPRIYED